MLIRAAFDRPILLAVSVSVAIAGITALWAVLPVKVIEDGATPSWFDPETTYEVRVFDDITVYAAKESRPDPDIFSGALLVALATAALIARRLLAEAGQPARRQRFYAFAAAGFVLLAFDEFLAIHETIGFNARPLADVPGVEHPDDVIFAALLLPAAVFIYLFRDIVLARPDSRWLFGGALAAFALTAVFDIAGHPLEEPLEIVTGGLIAIGFASLVASDLSDCLVPAPEPGSSGLALGAPAAPGARPPGRSVF